MFGSARRIPSSRQKQDNEDDIIQNEVKEDMNNDSVSNKIQKNRVTIMEKTEEEQMTDATILRHTDPEIEDSSQAHEDPILKKIESAQTIKRTPKFNLEIQAEEMKTISAGKYPNMKVGQNVRLKIPDIDRAKTDTKSIIAVVVDLYTKNQFSSCSEEFVKVEEFVKHKEVSLREVVRKLSLTGGQGFKKCNCLKKCLAKKCTCKSSGLLCNSKCHNTALCCNKIKNLLKDLKGPFNSNNLTDYPFVSVQQYQEVVNHFPEHQFHRSNSLGPLLLDTRVELSGIMFSKKKELLVDMSTHLKKGVPSTFLWLMAAHILKNFATLVKRR
nr:unnamed protein product [Callosobruchus analis]